MIYVNLEINGNTYHLYNALVSQDDILAVRALEAIENHCNQHIEGLTIIAGDFNCTLNSSSDYKSIHLVRNNPNRVGHMSKARLDRFYVPKALLSPVHSCDAHVHSLTIVQSPSDCSYFRGVNGVV